MGFAASKRYRFHRSRYLYLIRGLCLQDVLGSQRSFELLGSLRMESTESPGLYHRVSGELSHSLGQKRALAGAVSRRITPLRGVLRPRLKRRTLSLASASKGSVFFGSSCR